MTATLAPPTLSAPPADLDRRFYGYAIDRALAWAVDAAAVVVLYQVLVAPGQVWQGVAAMIGVVLVVGAVFAVVTGLTGGSPGMAIAGIRVLRPETGRPIGVGRAMLRQLILGVAGLPTLGLGVATLAWTAAMDPSGRRRGWHDQVSRSEVVDARPVPEEEAEPDAGPRHVVNLTALRLVPAPVRAAVSMPSRRSPGPPPPPAPPVPLPVSPPPSRPPSRVLGRRAAVPVPEPEITPAPVPEATPAPVPEPVPARGPAARQQLGYPLVPEPRPERPAGGAHAAREPDPTPVEEPEPRWRISFDSGETLLVEGLTLVGRRPEPRHGEPAVALVELRSEDMSLSKTHAQLQVAADGALVVMDRGSTNGSFLVRQGVPRGLPAGRAATLVDGDHVRFGDREMTVEREH